MRRWAIRLSPLLVVPVALLLLDRFGVIDIDRRITLHRWLVANVVLYWLALWAVVVAVAERRRLGPYLRRNRAGFVVAVCATVAALVTVELVLRWTDHPSSRTGFRWIGSRQFHHVNLRASHSFFRKVLIRTNPDGFRTDYTRESFLRHRVRVVAMGDSFLFGAGVEQDETMTAVLQANLRQRTGSDDVAVMNTGVDSHSPMLHHAVFHEIVVHYAPTVTLLFLDGNDIGDDYQYGLLNTSGDPLRPVFDVPENPPGFRSAAVRFAGPLLFGLRAPYLIARRFMPQTDPETPFDIRSYYDFRIDIGGVEETNRWFILRHPLAQTRRYFEATLGYVEAIAAEAKAAGSEFVLVVTPRYFHWSDRECPDNWTSDRYRNDEPYEYAYFEFFDSVSQSVPFRIHSLLPEFQATDEFPLVFANDPHWNSAGHRFVARAIADHLIAEGLVP